MTKEVKILDVQDNKKKVFIQDRSLPPLLFKKQQPNQVLTHNYATSTQKRIFDNDFLFPEYNFSDINRVIETEPLISRVFDRKVILCVKEGFEIVSKNQKITDYLRLRLNEIESKTGISLRILVEEAITGLIRHSNHFFVFKRDKKHSSGLTRNVEGIKIDPIAGIYSVPIETVQMRFNEHGHCDAIRQELSPFGFRGFLDPDKQSVIFDRNRFVHFYLYYFGGLSVCPPMLMGVKEDIIALRKIEENLELLLYQYLFPLYHYKIGTDELPAREYPDGTTEISRTADTVATLPSEGCVVTSHRHEIQVLGAARDALDPLPALEWYKKRILAGVAASALDLGESDTANRSTSDTLSRLIVDFCKYIQNQVAYLFESLIFKQLLAESTFTEEDLNIPENKAILKFKEIDLDQLTKKENHLTQLFTQSMITHDEARIDMGRDILDDSGKELLLMNIQHARSVEKTKIEADSAAKLAANGQAQGEARSQPENQHGKKENSEKAKSSFKEAISSSNPLHHKLTLSEIWNSWQQAKEYIAQHPQRKQTILPLVFSTIKEKFLNRLHTRFAEGYKDVLLERQSYSPGSYVSRDFYLIDVMITELFDRLIKDAIEIEDLNKLDFRIALIECAEQSRSYNFGRLRCYKDLGLPSVSIYKLREDVREKLGTIQTGDRYDVVSPILHPNSQELIAE